LTTSKNGLIFLTYITKQQVFNSGFGWWIYSSRRWIVSI